MQRKFKNKNYVPPYSFFFFTNAFTDNEIIKVWVPKSDEIQNSKFQKKQFVYKI